MEHQARTRVHLGTQRPNETKYPHLFTRH